MGLPALCQWVGAFVAADEALGDAYLHSYLCACEHHASSPAQEQRIAASVERDGAPGAAYGSGYLYVYVKHAIVQQAAADLHPWQLAAVSATDSPAAAETVQELDELPELAPRAETSVLRL